MRNFVRGCWILMVIIILTLLLTGCSNKLVVNHESAYVVVQEDKKLLRNGDLLYGKNHKLIFSFISNKSSGLTPMIYSYGPMSVNKSSYPTLDMQREKDSEEGHDSSIKPDTSYYLFTDFKKPGQAVIMFLWASKRDYPQPFLLYFEYDPD